MQYTRNGQPINFQGDFTVDTAVISTAMNLQGRHYISDFVVLGDAGLVLAQVDCQDWHVLAMTQNGLYEYPRRYPTQDLALIGAVALKANGVNTQADGLIAKMLGY